MKPLSFFNMYSHGYIRVAAAIPSVKVGDPISNVKEIVRLMEKAYRGKAVVALFPELGISSYSCDDLFHQQVLLDACLDGLKSIVEASKAFTPLIAIVGLPLQVGTLLFNCAAVVQSGVIMGIVPKMFIPNSREFYEFRYFAPGSTLPNRHIRVIGQNVPFGSKLLFKAVELPDFAFFVEICEDLWAPIPPSCYGALAGATCVFNMSASNVVVGKDVYRRQLVANQSGRLISAYVYVAAGYGESTTDLAWDGHAMIYENSDQLAESRRFSYEPQIVFGDVDLHRLMQDRMKISNFNQSVGLYKQTIEKFVTIEFPLDLSRWNSHAPLLLQRAVERYPFVPSSVEERDARCHEVYEIQVQGLVKRLSSSGTKKVVIGISGGLDSTQALLVCARAMDVLGLPRSNILGYTLPGYATSKRTKEQAYRLMRAIGCEVNEIDITSSCDQMLKDIRHPFGDGIPQYDVAFENVQAGERTSHLFRLANYRGAMVVGTSDLSEMALGWCTYGVGDHMAHYHLNASVPKTLIQYLIRWVSSSSQFGAQASEVLDDILATKISPELVPHAERRRSLEAVLSSEAQSRKAPSGEPAQSSEKKIGPFCLQDFHLYYILRFGYRPSKVAFLAFCAWHDVSAGTWPLVPSKQKQAFDIAIILTMVPGLCPQIKLWLRVFLRRFFGFAQFKRTCVANGPKVGTGGSLSPRGDYRAPSDGEAAVWLAELEARVPEAWPVDAVRADVEAWKLTEADATDESRAVDAASATECAHE